jgi:ubiquinone/menaquinone biosynthesis C-methylase UbiE
MPVYDHALGQSYTTTRRADPRITDAIIRLLALPPGAVVADLGAGTGNYARALAERGYRIMAVEPSAVMRAQAAVHPGVVWLPAAAEAIPLPDRSVDAVINLLSFHHYADPAGALQEMARIVGEGPILLLTFDAPLSDRFWFADYFPSIWTAAFALFPSLDQLAWQIAVLTDREVTSEPFPLPHDLQDLFLGAGWRRPELYLDPTIRANMSAFAAADPERVRAGLTRLAEDLESGRWQHRHGAVLAREAMDLGYRFLVARPAAG